MLLEALKANKYRHIYWINVLMKLKKQEEYCINQAYLETFWNPILGLANITPNQIIRFLCNTYATINEIDFKTNKTTMMKQYNLEQQPIGILVQQLEQEIFLTTTGHQSITDRKMVTKGIILLSNTAIFNQDFQKWQCLPLAQRKWQYFQVFFHHAHKA